MPRRLGDDPLTRARSQRAKAAEGSAPVALGSGGQEGTAQLGIQPSLTSNDVFFQRRGENFASQQVATVAPRAPEAPEISEISEIPEIRDAAATSQGGPAFEVTSDAMPESVAVQDAPVVQTPPVSIIGEVVARLNASAAAAHVDERPASPLPESQVPADGGDEAKPEPQKSGGFFKRLFGKFK